MESYNLSQAIKKLYQSPTQIWDMKLLQDVPPVESASTFHKLIGRLVREKILERVERSSYILADFAGDELEIANFLYAPSYVSFETALSYYGILSQFPYEVTSATLKKAAQKSFKDQSFSYSHLQQSLYWGYQKQGKILIAEREKALVDQLYFVSKGLKVISIEELDLTQLDQKKLQLYFEKFPQTSKFILLKHQAEQQLKGKQ
jgi:predicted transcriptional regulator of viral defense system